MRSAHANQQQRTEAEAFFPENGEALGLLAIY